MHGLAPPPWAFATSAALRRASSPKRRFSATTTARKLASLRALFRSLREHGHIAAEPRRPARHAASRLPSAARAQGARGRRACSTASPAGEPRCEAARPGAVRARLRVRSARRGDRLPERRRPRLRRRAAARRGQGLEDPLRARRRGRRGRAGVRRRVVYPASRARPALALTPADGRRRARPTEPALFLSTLRPAAGHERRAPPPARVGRRGRASPAASPHMLCATPSPPTCSTAAPTCAPSRSCSAIRASQQPRSTLG